MDWDREALPGQQPVRRGTQEQPRREPGSYLASLQGSVGNAAVAQLLAGPAVQRAPSRASPTSEQPRTAAAAPESGPSLPEDTLATTAASGVGNVLGTSDAGRMGAEAALTQRAYPLLQRGASGPDVLELQIWLANRYPAVAVDGSFGPQTAAYVCLLQKNTNLTVDGQVGRQTWDMMDAIDPDDGAAEPAATPGETGGTGFERPASIGGAAGEVAGAPAPRQPGVQRAPTGGDGGGSDGGGSDGGGSAGGENGGDASARTMSMGTVGGDVSVIQTGLTMAYPGSVQVDGVFGEATLAYVLLYQVDHGLVPDGVVGPETRKHLDPVQSANRKLAAAQDLSASMETLGSGSGSPFEALDVVQAVQSAHSDVATLQEKDF